MKTKHKVLLTTASLFLMTTAVNAAPRSTEEMKQIAEKTFMNIRKSLPRKSGVDNSRDALKIQKVKEGNAYQIFQNIDGGFVVVSSDDLLPEILAYSEQGTITHSTDTSNPGLEWWLKAMDEATTSITASGKRFEPIKPDLTKFPERVSPLVTAKWGQEEPYFNECPWGSTVGSMGGTEQGRCLTGCVATAIAQIMYYHKFPAHGQGYNLIYYPSGDISGQKLEIDYSESYYDWDNMIDSYSNGYTEVQAQAVAKLMYDCGVASNMIYRPTASGALTQDAADGLVKFFGYSKTTIKEDRDNYSDSEWMNKVYTELSSNRPFYYGANDVAAGGHAFVIDGYNADGLVHVNWGWEGSENGYYDISILNPRSYQFSVNQDAIMGIIPDAVMETIKESVTVNSPGELAHHFTKEEQMRVKELTVKGQLNSSDIHSIRLLAGVDENGEPTNGILKKLDLSEATIISGGEPYLSDGNLTTSNNAIGKKMFAGCTALRSLKLPENITKIGDGAFIGCTRLEELQIPQGNDKEYILEGNLLYNSEKTEIIGVLPFDATAYYEIPSGVTGIHDYAFYHAVKLTNIVLPSSLRVIGESAFEGDPSLRQIKLFSIEPPTVGKDCFKDVKKYSCFILVRSGSKTNYEKAEGWKEFKGVYDNAGYPINFDNIKEYGTSVKVTNAYREYGEANPSKFGYKVTGDKLSGGTPVITCEADEYSPVGQYVIHIEAGSITDEAVDYEDGILFVMPALLTIKVDDAYRKREVEDPVFTFTYDGFKNNEDESVLEMMPIVTSSATFDSPAGEYTLSASGASAHNYDIEYIDGILYILQTSSISDIDIPREYPIYDLQGRMLTPGTIPQPGIYICNGKKLIFR